LYEKFFKGYTNKQWGLDPSELDATVTSRVPTRSNRDDRYFTDTFQAMPKHGYTRMFERMLDHPNIKVMLNTDYQELKNEIKYKELVYTGPVDAFFDYCYGKLPYRSLEFKHETHDTETFQEAPVINYPNEQAYTRVTEFKYLTGQKHHKTAVVYEFPRAEGDPYYPIPRPENTELYRKYQALANARDDVHFVGRLATYKYYNMDQIVGQALTVYSKMVGLNRKVAAQTEVAAKVYSIGGGLHRKNGNVHTPTVHTPAANTANGAKPHSNGNGNANGGKGTVIVPADMGRVSGTV